MAYNDRGGRGGKRGGGGGYGGGGYGGGYGGGGHSGGGYGGGSRHGGGNRPPMQMHEATCAQCGKSCEVPFRPSNSKPVFCTSCFKGKNSDSDGGRPGKGRDFDRRDDSGGGRRGGYSDNQMYDAVCSDCGRDCEVPFKPSGDKPIYCDKCFGRNKDIKVAKPAGGGNGKLDEKLKIIDIKLDRILKALEAKVEGKVADKVSQKKDSPEKVAPVKAKVKAANKKVKSVKLAKSKRAKTNEK